MRTRSFPLAAAVALCALAAPASAQIIATSIPKEFSTGTATGAQRRWAFHVMGAPIAKWKINQFEETDTAILSTRANPNSKFLGAAEVAFTAGSDMTVGLGGWFNKVGSTNYDFDFVDVSDGVLGLSGIRTDNLTYTEGHVNVFYKDIGVQVGVVHGKATTTGLTIETFLLDDLLFSRADLVSILGADGVASIEADARDTITTNDTDGYLIYKLGSRVGNNFGWTFSLGAGAYRYGNNKKTVPSGFGTVSLDLYKGLGVDASFWYIGKSKSDLQKELGVSDNLSRFSIGIGYTFSK